MRKSLLTLSIFFSLVVAANAQSGKGISLSLGPELDIPFNTTTYDYGNVRDTYQDGVGFVLKAELPISRTVFFTGSAGFAWYPSNTHFNLEVPGPNGSGAYNFTVPPYKFVPLKAGLQYYFVKYLYVEGECGFAVATTYYSNTNFIYSGGTGAVIPLTTRSRLDLHIRYERGFEVHYYPLPMSQLSIGAAYKFGW